MKTYIIEIQDKKDKIWEFVCYEKNIAEARKTAKRQCTKGDKILSVKIYEIKVGD